jgi:putative transposase
MTVPLNAICTFFGRTRQAFYKRQQRSVKAFIQEQQIIAEVHRIRSKQPKVGGRKLLKDIQTLGFDIGRDQLFDILRKHGMLIKRKRRGPRTTNSNHWLRKYTNLVRGVPLTGPNQVFVSDITYLRIASGDFAYLCLVTDAWSRKIVGWDVSSSLGVKGAIRALKMALKNVPHPEGLIHHSDRGIQYCCNEYINILNDHHVLVSMTEDNHCYENAIAERINGILKDEFCLNTSLPSLKVAKELVRESIHIYNHYRRHMSLDYQIPAEVHHDFT